MHLFRSISMYLDVFRCSSIYHDISRCIEMDLIYIPDLQNSGLGFYHPTSHVVLFD